MTRNYHTADVFTSTAFGGNQLAVLPDGAGLSDAEMLAIAREFNFPETVFVLPPENSAHTRRLRIFTPGGELPFAGHPTVGTAFVLAHVGEVELTGAETRIVFEEGVGPVPVLIRAENGVPVFAELTAAKLPERGIDTYDADTVAAVLSLAPADIRTDGGFAIEGVSCGVPFLFVPVRDLDALGRARVKLDLWEEALKNSWAPEIYLFVEDAASATRNGVATGDGVIRARMFAPKLGIAEDPATGGAAAAFAGYLTWRATKRDGTLKWTINQGVEMGRPSRLEVEADVEGGEVREVRVGGASVLVSSGVLHVP
ncbi:MAG: PhzF family phenazine biosynthesis protein [Gemmatimonadaceae bacterium]|nr:PhzF family phenazine biosynthesis protein [Gemmatimonadaceae bacterium]